jgi:hypothetical protein
VTPRNLILALVLLLPSVARAGDLVLYETKYYNIYTDIDPEEEKEAAIRMTKMAEEYHARTRDFAGQIQEKLPFYLYKSPEDFYRAGGLKGSAGVFIAIGNGGKLMAIAGRHGSQQTWHTVQHEGFHQFAHQVIGGQMPVWLNEGLAEYFGESIFTGDGFVTGVIPPWRLSRIKDELNANQLKSFPEMTHLTSQEWSDQLSLKNYDQVWSMVYFLVHADDQKYQQPLVDFIHELSRGIRDDTAWNDTLANSGDLQERWRTWWTTQPANATPTLYAQAAVSTMTSFVARAFVEKQTFKDFDAFRAAVDNDTLKIDPDDWLPHSLIADALRLYGDGPRWEITPGKQPAVIVTLSDGTRVTGTFTLRGNRVEQVKTETDNMAPMLKAAQKLLDQNKKELAKQTVQNAMKINPKSPLMADARKLLQSCR